MCSADKSELFLDVCAVYKDLMHDYQPVASGLCTLLKQNHHMTPENYVTVVLSCQIV